MGSEAVSLEPTSPAARGLMARTFTFFGDLLSATWPRLTAVIAAKT